MRKRSIKTGSISKVDYCKLNMIPNVFLSQSLFTFPSDKLPCDFWKRFSSCLITSSERDISLIIISFMITLNYRETADMTIWLNPAIILLSFCQILSNKKEEEVVAEGTSSVLFPFSFFLFLQFCSVLISQFLNDQLAFWSSESQSFKYENSASTPMESSRDAYADWIVAFADCQRQDRVPQDGERQAFSPGICYPHCSRLTRRIFYIRIVDSWFIPSSW